MWGWVGMGCLRQQVINLVLFRIVTVEVRTEFLFAFLLSFGKDKLLNSVTKGGSSPL